MANLTNAANPRVVKRLILLLSAVAFAASIASATEPISELRAKAEAGDAPAQLFLGVRYFNGLGVVKDEVEAVKWCRKAAEQGNAEAQFNLGVMYDNGQGVVKDQVEAAKWYRKAAEQGYAEAQYNLGVLYANGWGVAKDQVEAYAWFNLAALKVETGRINRETLEKILSREEIAAGQQRTRELQKEIEAKR